jgi:hypothetical protein
MSIEKLLHLKPNRRHVDVGEKLFPKPFSLHFLYSSEGRRWRRREIGGWKKLKRTRKKLKP